MKDLLAQIKISVNEALFLKDPDSTSTGRRIVSGSIELIGDIGFENFTFKKLGQKIGSPESTIYRYFESKHTILLYLISWYWCWLEYRLVFATANISSPDKKLKAAIELLTCPVKEDSDFSHVNEVGLSQLIIKESTNSYHTRQISTENEKGIFEVYERLVERVGEMLLAINPTFPYPHMLASTVIEGVYQQRYFAGYMPSLTDVKTDGGYISDFYTRVVFNTLKDKY